MARKAQGGKDFFGQETAVILIGLGANLPHNGRPPQETLETALTHFPSCGMTVAACSRWYRSAAMGREGLMPEKPDYINGVAAITTALSPEGVLGALHGIEDRFGRVRERRWESRTLDLDLLDYNGRREGHDPLEGLVLPHPELGNRAFVLLPLAEIAADWRHPGSGLTIPDLLAALPESVAGSVGVFEGFGREG